MEGQATAERPSTLKFPCSACGADLEFAVGSQELKCPYCNHTEVIPTSGEEIVEHEFESYDALGLEKGWGADLKDIKCDMCGAAFHIEPHVTSTDCPFCGSSQVQEQEDDGSRLKPQSLIPFQVSKEEVGELFKTWISKLWFRPDALKKLAVSDSLKGVYIPFWTFDSLTYSFWRAEAGYYYYEEEEYETVEDGETVTKTREVRKIRWEWEDGRHQKFFDDVLVPASTGIDDKLSKRLRYDTDKLQPYQPEYLVGLGAEDYRIDMPEAWPDARAQMDARIRSECRELVPGDTHRNLHVDTSYLNRTFKLCLLPVWVATYRFGGEQYRYLCNGQSGKIEGDAPISWVKVIALVATIAAIITALVLIL